MTEPHDDWANLADNLGLSDQPAERSVEKSDEPPAPRGRGRRRSAEPTGERPAPERSGEPSGEDRPRRGRRRSPKPEPAPVNDDPFLQGIEPQEEVVAEPSEGDGPVGEEGEGEPRKRRRRRGRRKKSGVVAGEGEVLAPVGEEAESEGDSEEVDTAPIENYSSLNMPSWQELIDGLYKP